MSITERLPAAPADVATSARGSGAVSTGHDRDEAAASGSARVGVGLSRLESHRTWVQDRPATYGAGGQGPVVVFLHGWLLGHRSYRCAAEELIALGYRVYAPSLPGFGGTADLPGRRFSLRGYGHWVDAFCAAMEIDGPVHLVGHSFGGGVAIKVAHDHPDRIRSAVLVDAVGGGSWKLSELGKTASRLAERPLWDWGLHVRGDFWPLTQAVKVIPAMLQDAAPNLVRNPLAVLRVAQLARSADLGRELAVLRDRHTPVHVLWGARDGLIPRASFDSMCAALGSEGQLVQGSHSWPLADPEGFAGRLAALLQLSP
jgi:pimeloyl-ACP methyl ester carboxylesterase